MASKLLVFVAIDRDGAERERHVLVPKGGGQEPLSRKGAPQFAQHVGVQHDGLPVGRLGAVGDAKFFRCLLHNGRNLPQMDVANLGEEVMLDLVIQAAHTPCE